jgi:glucosylglycerate synthase
MARSSILSDELLRHLVAVGQVDILVGVPTFNNAATVQAVVKSIHVGLAKHFPRERTVLINPDGGSEDGTIDLVRSAPMADEELRDVTTLRTTHRVSAPYHGLPDRAGGVRVVFAAADLLQARAVVIVDANVMNMTPDWVAELARPVWKNEADLVLPIHPRQRFEGPLLTQLIRPLLSATYARRLRSNTAGNFCCSGRFAARLVGHGMWERELSFPALDVWTVTAALAEDLRLVQVHLGPNLSAPRAGRAGLPELFEQAVGTTLECLELYASSWIPRAEVVDVATIGMGRELQSADGAVETAPMVERFRSGVRDLAPLLHDILQPETLARLQAVTAALDREPLQIPDSLWVAMVYEFAASAHRGVMNRQHLTQALVPLYLGRVASFFAEIASADEATYMKRLTALDREYEGMRPYLVERWNADVKR